MCMLTQELEELFMLPHILEVILPPTVEEDMIPPTQEVNPMLPPTLEAKAMLPPTQGAKSMLLLTLLQQQDGAPAPTYSKKAEPLCTDVSYVKPIEYIEGEVCCITKVVEPYCMEEKIPITRIVQETTCHLVSTPKCYMKDCPVDCTYPEHYEKSFTPWKCEMKPKTLYHYKSLPVCQNVSKPICIEEWRDDGQGGRYKVITDKCERAYWEECHDEQKQVAFQTMESVCYEDKEIWYDTCKEITEPINMQCWMCQADALPVCETKKVEKTIEVTQKTCEPRTKTFCNPPKKMPIQEKVHQEKCLHHDGKTMVATPPTYAPSNNYSPPPTYVPPSQPEYQQYFGLKK